METKTHDANDDGSGYDDDDDDDYGNTIKDSLRKKKLLK